MSKESAAAYRSWLETPVYRDVMKIIEELKSESKRDEDSIPIDILTVQAVAQARGVRAGLDRLLKKIEERSVDPEAI